MNQHIRNMSLLASILALMLSACGTRSLSTAGTAGRLGAELPLGTQVTPRPTLTPESSSGNAGQGAGAEGTQAPPVFTSPVEPASTVNPESIPSQEERNAILDGVNLGRPIPPGSDQGVSAGPEPGTESDIVHEDIGQEEDRDDVLDQVNAGGPVLSGGGEEASQEPQPATESDTEQQSSPGRILNRFIETVRNWWREFLTWFDVR